MREVLVIGVVFIGGAMLLQAMRPPMQAAPLPQLPQLPPQTAPQNTNAYAGYGALAAGIGQGIGSVLGGIFGGQGYGAPVSSSGGYDSGAGVAGWTGISESSWGG